jgi:hypothetical protein
MTPSTSWSASGSFLNSFTAKSESMSLKIQVPNVPNHVLLLDSLELVCLMCAKPGEYCSADIQYVIEFILVDQIILMNTKKKMCSRKM